MKRFLLTTCFVFLIITKIAYAGKIHLTTLFQAPVGSFDRVRLIPRDNEPLNCEIGTLYINSESNLLFFCKNDGSDNGIWETLEEASWEQTGDRVYPNDSSLYLGIGTSTPLFRLSLTNDGGIYSKGTFGSGDPLNANYEGQGVKFIWYPPLGALWIGEIETKATPLDSYNFAGGAWSQSNLGEYSVVSGGLNNIAGGTNCTVLGGEFNIISKSAKNSSIGGGFGNEIDVKDNLGGNSNSSIVGGQNNLITLDGLLTARGFIGGGDNNTAQGTNVFIGGGLRNRIKSSNAAIVGGTLNKIPEETETTTPNCIIVGGMFNHCNGSSGGNHFIIGGQTNLSIDGDIIGGQSNQAIGSSSFIGGGEQNIIEAQQSTIIGGVLNKILGNTNLDNVIIGGSTNKITSSNSRIGAGGGNEISEPFSVILGGLNNKSHGTYSVIHGGVYNTANGGKTWVGGQRMLSAIDYAIESPPGIWTYYYMNSFIWGHSDSFVNFPAQEPGFYIYSGNVGIGTTALPLISSEENSIAIGTSNPNKQTHFYGLSSAGVNDGDVCTAAGNCLSGVLSDVRLKENIAPLKSVLDDFNKLHPVTFNWKDPKRHHNETHQKMGLIAQEVEEVFPQWVSENGLGIKVLTYNGFQAVCTQAIKEIDEKLETAVSDIDNKIINKQKAINRLKQNYGFH